METGGENSAAQSSALPSSPPCPIFARPHFSRGLKLARLFACALEFHGHSLLGRGFERERKEARERQRKQGARGKIVQKHAYISHMIISSRYFSMTRIQ